MTPRSTWPEALVTTELERVPELPALLDSLRSTPGLVALDSVSGSPRRWSWVAFEPRELIVRQELELDELRTWCAEGPQSGDVPGPFRGGFIGALSYDQGVAGDELELPADPWETPRSIGGLYAEFFVIDHERDRAWFVCGDDITEEARVRWIDRALSSTGNAKGFERSGELRRLVSRKEHTERVEAARQLIAAGEIYQANLAHPFEATTLGDPLDLYLRLRETNPAPYMAYLRVGDLALASSSPELLLDVQDGRARTRPIKGTIERSDDQSEDQRLARELMASAKDRAELAMIVDLERNDLGRVARAGSVTVDGFPALRSYENVHHLTADVSCELDQELDAIDALAALFPGGSITGAPKLRSMEAIAELEGEGRGFFTGSLGFLSCSGELCFNILIRTIVWRSEAARGARAGRVRYHVGGGITWGSSPAAEDDETLAKGARLAAALEARAQEPVA
jgi:para-aminobenzoate synthetase component I